MKEMLDSKNDNRNSIEELEKELDDHMTKRPERTKMQKFFMILLVLILVLTAARIIQTVIEDPEIEEPQLTNVEVTKVKVGNISVTAPVSGKITPRDEASVVVTMSGEVKTLNVEVGDFVKKGDVLYRVDAEQSVHAYDQAKLSADIAKTSLDTIKTSLDRTTILYNEGAVSLSELEAVQTQYNTTLLSYQQAQSALASASDALGLATSKAPISGYVSAVNLTKGTYAMSGSVAVIISDLSRLEINSSVSEYLIGSIKVGDSVMVYIKSVTDKPFRGIVTSVAKSPSAGTLTYPVKISIDEKTIKSGMFAEVQLSSSSKEGIIIIPSDSVMIKSGKSVVVVLTEDKANYREVKTGIDNGEQIEIVSGLTPGETVVVKGQTYISDGETVNVVNSRPEKVEE